MASLASLAIGEAWIWSPGWLDLFKRVQIRERKTFDSSATPKVGEKAKWPTATAVVDLEKLRAELASTDRESEGRGSSGATKKDRRSRGGAWEGIRQDVGCSHRCHTAEEDSERKL